MPTLEERVSELEAQMQEVRAKEKTSDHVAGWERIIGSFSQSEGFEEAVRLGREYREAQQPKDDEEPQ